MTRRAWIYIGSVLLAGAVWSGVAIAAYPVLSTSDSLTFIVLTALTLLTQFLEAEAPGRQSYYPHLVFLFAGVIVLPPLLFVPLVVIPHLVEWIRKRLAKSPMLRAWYIQPFNIATHLIAGITARGVFVTLSPDTAALTLPMSVMAVLLGALVYVMLNHLLIGMVLVLARGVNLRESGVFEVSNLLSDLVQLFLGYVVAILWQLNPLLMLPALSPLVMIYRALTVPQLQQEAHTDAKTGLLNARRFNQLFTVELERAKRFDRPLAVLMSDLDLLRNINNTYGHLAGDAVLTGIGQIIREIVREYDIPARFGGEEFCIVLLEAGVEEACLVAERLRAAVEVATFEVATSPHPIHATMSFGIACYPQDATTLTDLIHQADVAVYQAKLQGRNRVVNAIDVPHSVKLAGLPTEDRAEMQSAAAPIARPEPAGQAKLAADPPAQPAPSKGSDQPATARRYPKVSLPLFVSGVIVAGMAVTALGAAISHPLDLVAIALLVALAAIAEFFQVNVYGDNTVSVSVGIAFAAALIAGVPGAAAVSAGIAGMHYVQTRPPLYRTAFNWATHVLAGSAPAFVINARSILLHVSNLPLLVVLAAVTGLVYYAIETGLIATAISLSQAMSFKMVWRRQFQWLVTHYLVLCLMGLILAIAYETLGVPGMAVFVLPVFLARYSQKQYVERTEEGIRELKRMNQELTRANGEVVGASQAIRQLNDELFLTLAKIIDARDPYAAGHAAKVADYAITMATRLGLSGERLERLRQAALLHDIGKLAISERVLQKQDLLTREEYAYVQTHAALGADFLETCQGLRHLAAFVKRHHEWWDGRGYPDGLCGEDIPLEARILAVCDAVEAMSSDRPYHPAMSLQETISELRRFSGTQFDPTLVEMFIQVVEREGDRFVVNSAREVARRQPVAAAAVTA